ncbi:MAG: hypothetical protein E7Z92_00275 [Cyanobacteria bacterium SIG31]|nr:hypothetical protein [Cyanobacteria bacterium SIG31]
MLNVASVFSRLGNPNSLIPLAVKDLSATAGMTAGSFVTGKEEGQDRFIDEMGTEVIWLMGIPAFKWIFDKTVFKAMGMDAKFDARNLKDKDVFEKIKQYAPTEKIKENIEKIGAKEKAFKGAAMAKFIVATTLTIASYIGLTRFKQNYTEKKIRENLIAEYNQQKEAQKKNEAKKVQTVNPTFKGLGSTLQSFAFSPVKNMWILDSAITAERLKDSRSPQEFIGYGIKEASTLLFMYYAGGKIQELLEKQASKQGKSIALDARVLENGFLKKAFEDGSILASLEEFKAISGSNVDLYEFLHKNPNNLVVETAKMSDVIEMYKEPQGLFKRAKVTDKIDTRKYIDIDGVKSIGAKLEELYSNYKTALSKGESSEKFFESVKTLKRKSIITNIGTCILALGVVTPAIMLAKRLAGKDDAEFQTKKEIREKLINEGLIA